MAKRACPHCGVRGLEHITSRETTRVNEAGNPWFEVICDQCGHLYGAVASRTPQAEEPSPLEGHQPER